MDVKEMARLGGNVRARALTPEKRREIASKGGKAGARARKKTKEEKASKTVKTEQ